VLTKEILSIFVDSFPFDHLIFDIWSKIVLHLKGNFDDDLRFRGSRRSQNLFESKILGNFPSILDESERKKWTLLRRGTHDGFGSSSFHAKCDNQSNTLIVVLTTKGFFFGGFTPVGWDSSSSDKSDSSRTSFVFSVGNPRESEERKFSISDSRHAISCNFSYGPTFGHHSQRTAAATRIVTQALEIHVRITQIFTDTSSSLATIISQ
jgi:hypothetical protein